jgi:hypothetical protein
VSESRLEHYAYRGSPPDWRCRAALPHAFNGLRSRAPRRQPEAALQDHSPTHRGVGATRVAHRGEPWDHDWQICPDQRVSTMNAEPGRRRRARRAHRHDPGHSRKPPPTRTFPPSEHDRAATTQVSRNELWAPVQHGQERLPGTRGSGLPRPRRGIRAGVRTRFGHAPPTTPPRPSGYTRWRPVRDPGRSVSGPPRCSGRARAWCATPPWKRAADLMECWLGLLQTPSGPTKPAPSTTAGPTHLRRSLSGSDSGGRWPGTAARRSPTAA